MFVFIDYISFKANSKTLIFRNVMFLIIKIIFPLVQSYYVFRRLLVFMSYLIAKGCHRAVSWYVMLHSAGERGSTVACAGGGQGFCWKIQVAATVCKELRTSSTQQGLQGLIYLLMACIIGKMGGVKMRARENKHLKYFFIHHQ